MFKPGQIVWCKMEGRYSQTDYHIRCVVVNITGYLIRVKILEGKNAGYIWQVDPCCFELVQRNAKIV